MLLFFSFGRSPQRILKGLRKMAKYALLDRNPDIQKTSVTLLKEISSFGKKKGKTGFTLNAENLCLYLSNISTESRLYGIKKNPFTHNLLKDLHASLDILSRKGSSGEIMRVKSAARNNMTEIKEELFSMDTDKTADLPQNLKYSSIYKRLFSCFEAIDNICDSLLNSEEK